MSFVKSLYIAALVSVFGGMSVHAETLSDAVVDTLNAHPSMDGAVAAIKAKQEDKAAQFSGYFPKVNINATAGREFANNSTSRGLSVTRGEGYSGLGQGGIAARQMIFDGMETSARVGAAKQDVKAAEMDLAAQRDDLAMRTVQTFLNLHRANEGLKMLQGQEKNVSSYLQRIQGMVNEGASDEVELQQARDVQAILDNYTSDYEGQVHALEADYRELTGHMPQSALVMPQFQADSLPKTVDEAVEIARATHPQIKSALFQEGAAAENIKAEEATLYPDLIGELSYDETDKRDVIGGESTSAKAVLRMNWDLETGGGQLARIRSSRYVQSQASAQARELQNAIERAVRQAYSELETAQSQLKNQITRVDLNTKLLEAYKSQFEAAKITLLQLMQSDNQLLITKLERLNAENRVLLAQYNILAAMGRIQPALNVNLAQAETK